MSESRPDPDQLLSRIQAEEARARRGKLRIFFGASAGVGKTYAMLGAARQQLLQGVDVLVGVVETHGRMETEVMADGLERLPLREVEYRGRVLRGFDLGGALARKPALILVDELAHSNVQGSRHPKRWQDVEELLAAGIDVYTTVNVQHLETLNDVVSGITGIRVWETVPDRIFDTADEVVLVDLPPNELMQRLKEGKVYLPNQAERAIRNFFRKGNLIALRELALRRTADRVDDDMLEYRRNRLVTPVWQTRESLLACIGPGAGGERVVRSAARIAGKLEAPWHAIYVETPALQRLDDERRQHVLRNLKLAQDLGAQTATLAGRTAEQTAIGYAREHNLGTLVVGRAQGHGWRPWRRAFAARIGERAPDLNVTQVACGDERGARPRAQPSGTPRAWRDYAMAGVLCVGAALLSTFLHPLFDLANIVMVFLLAVVLAGVRYGRGPAVLASFLSVAAFDFFFVPPRLSFAVSDVQYLLTFLIMLAVGLITGQLTAGFKYQAHVATRREQRMRALYEMSRDLSGALLAEQIAEIGERFLASEFAARTALALVDENDQLLPPLPSARPVSAFDHGVARWAFDHGECAGAGTDTLPGSPVLYLPLKAPMRLRGVLAVELPDAGRLLIPEQRRLLDTFSSLLAIAIERVHYVEVARDTTVQMESERLRNSLLSAISHDIRTPLSVLVGLADSMFLSKPPPTAEQAEIAQAMRETTLRINAQVSNMLDMARLQAGRIQLKREWQPLEETVVAGIKGMEAALLGHRIDLRIPEELPLVEIDAVLMERVIGNLLENAAKYTPAGTTISIGARADGDTVEFWVADRGPGVSRGKEEATFKKCERGARESTIAGGGLGLAICRAIVEAHGGRIHAENPPDGGARFVVRLPAGSPPHVEAETAVETETESERSPEP